MELTALRASLQHKRFRDLKPQWTCPMTPALPKCKGARLVELDERVPDFSTAAFREPAVGAQWARMAAELEYIYTHRARHAVEAAQRVSDLMAQMAELLPFAHNTVVHDVLRRPLLPVPLNKPGFYVYCLVSPFCKRVYVGLTGWNRARSPYDRLRNHIGDAKLWGSKTSKRQYGARTPDLYAALHTIGLGNFIQVILAEPTHANLAAQERAFIRSFRPESLFNLRDVQTTSPRVVPAAVAHLLGEAASEDVGEAAAALLRKNHPQLRPSTWLEWLSVVRAMCPQELAAKATRQARQCCPALGKLRAFPRLVFPCPLPAEILQVLRGRVKATLLKLPFIRRTYQFPLMVEGASVCWERSPYAEAVLSPAAPVWDQVGPCSCAQLSPELPRCGGHVVSRTWDTIPCCRQLSELVGGASLQCRTFPSLERICEQFGDRVTRYLRAAGFSEEEANQALSPILRTTRRVLAPWLQSLPHVMQQGALLSARRAVWAGGLLMVKVDRNPGRVMVVCRELWKRLQNEAYLSNGRYHRLELPPSDEDTQFAEGLRESFKTAVPGAQEWMGRRPSGPLGRPSCYFTIKQKSLITSSPTPKVKVRPIVSHSRHPLQPALKRLARALSVLVCEARALVLERRRTHLPMWQLHAGSAEWLKKLVPTAGWWGYEEFDVMDCFLNTARDEVELALDFWLNASQGRTRRQPCFGISKDGKAGDKRGRPPVEHYWVIHADQLRAAVHWDLTANDAFEVRLDDGSTVVLGQKKGLPIGGHLSAACVELVALRREYIAAEWTRGASWRERQRRRGGRFGSPHALPPRP